MDSKKIDASYHQERLWFIDQFETGTLYDSHPVYHNIPLVLEIKGTIDIALLEQSIKDVINRHEVLRTRIVTIDNRPVQSIEEEVAVRLERLELLDKSSNNIDNQVLDVVLEYVTQPIPLDGKALFRVGLLERSERHYLLCFVFHHIICDRYSLTLAAREMVEIYKAYVKGGEPALPKPPFQYADFSQWQRELPEDVLESLLFYWKGKLRGGIQALELPTDSPRLALHVFHGARLHFEISPTVAEKIAALAEQRGVNPATVLMAAFKVLLYKYTGQEEIVIGTSAANRDQPGLDQVVGPIANLLVVRSTISGHSLFFKVLSDVQKTLDEAYKYGAMPFDRLASEINPYKDMSRTVFFDVLFQYEERPLEFNQVQGTGIESIQVIEFNLGWGKYDLNLLIQERGEGFSAVLVYNSDYYKGSTVARLFQHFQQLLEQLCSSTISTASTSALHQPISFLSLLSESEQQQLVYEFNNTSAHYSRDKTIHRLFEEQVERTGDNIAVNGISLHVGTRFIASVFCSTSITYNELNEKSNGLALILRDRGVEPDTIVGIMAEPCIEVIIGMLGILKAGGAYLSIDPDYPDERKQYMLKDSNATVLLTSRNLSKNIAFEKEIIYFEDYKEKEGIHHSSFITHHSDNLAYVIYTSGTTGKPKGSLITHQNVVRLMANDRFPFDFNERDVWTLFHSFCFDFSVWEMYGALLYGGQLVIIPRMTARSPGEFLNVLIAQKVTVLNQTPPAFYNLIREELSNKNKKDKQLVLRYVIFGGDILHPSRLKEWKEKYPDTRLINMFGITETTVHVTFKEITEREIAQTTSNIGTPIPTLTGYVLDERQALLPIGVAGELVVGGDGVCRGYLNRVKLTTGKFIPNPHKPGERIYRSGDRVRLLDNGEMEYLGRIDHQVKIRGFRIERGEIQHCLLEIHDVKECVVIDKIDESGNKYLCAYIVSEKTSEKKFDTNIDININTRELRNHLSRKLPDYMIPAYFVQIDSIPLTPNNKTDRKALPDPEVKAGAEYTPPGNETEKKVAAIWAEVLKVKAEVIGRDSNFFEIGGNSLKITYVTARIKEIFDKDIPVVTMFEYPTIATFSYHLSQLDADTGKDKGDAGEAGEVSTSPEAAVTLREEAGGKTDEIAVIGMAGRFSGADSIDAFWGNLKNGEESISRFTDEELIEAGIDPQLLTNPNYVKAWGILENKAYFDASFFEYTPGDADIMDPQMRIFHECCWEALEHAGYDPTAYEGSIGIYSGGGHNFTWEMFCQRSGKNDTVGEWAADKLNNIDYLSTRIAYNFNFRGPAVTVQTACSTSLVAIHMACQALLKVNQECHMALAGGVDFSMSRKSGYLYQGGMVLSPDGHCRAFDARAGGTVPGDGAGVVVLKPLANALADGDTIHAVIKGSAINNDGKLKVGFAAPGVKGQKAVIETALGAAQVEPESIGCIEAHGTGTTLGDPIEIEALKQAFNTNKQGFCAIGSVKTNIGHTGSAAGVIGLIKVVLALKFRLIPPSLFFSTPNPNIDFKNSPFYVNTELKEWKNEKYPLRAGVSSFGIGGTNAHVILEEAPVVGRKETDGGKYQLIVLSAKTPSALDKMTKNLSYYLTNNPGNPASPGNFGPHPGFNLADVAYTLQTGRKTFKSRGMMVCSSIDEAVECLSKTDSGMFKTFSPEGENQPVVFMFSGQGSQYVNMGIDLYKTEPVFQEAMNSCFDILKSLMDYDLKEILYPLATRNSQLATRPEKINQTEITQPVIFAFEYALAQLLISWGITPFTMIGHSIGEYTAACLAGVFSLEDALSLVLLRGKLMQSLPEGSMLSIPITEKELRPLLEAHSELSIAAVNTLSHCVVSGPFEAVVRFERQLKAEKKEIKSRWLHTSHAFHSSMMDPILGRFEEQVCQTRLNKPQIPYISNVTGLWITPEEAADPGYWSRHIRETVRFADGLNTLLKEENTILVEVGPGNALTTFARNFTQKKPGQLILNLIRHPKEKQADDHYLLDKIGQMWLHGKQVEWRKFYPQQPPRRIPLPTYPFEGRCFPIESTLTVTPGAEEQFLPKTDLSKKTDMADWFYIPYWKRAPLPANSIRIRDKGRETGTPWLVFTLQGGLGFHLKEYLQKEHQQVVMVEAGSNFLKENDHRFIIDPREEEHYDTLFNHLADTPQMPGNIVHLWSVSEPDGGSQEIPWEESLDKWLDLGLYSLLNIAKAIGKWGKGHPVDLAVVTDHMQDVTGKEKLCPAKAAVLGPVTVIPEEYPNIQCRSIDLDFPNGSIDALVRELKAETPERVVAFRSNHRWVRRFDPFRMESPAPADIPLLKEEGVYLITGGLGGIGLELAHYLAKSVRARLILIGRSPFPARAEWDQWLNAHEAEDDVSSKIKKIKEIETSGSQAMVFKADVSNAAQMQAVISQAEQQWGCIHGIIHAAGIADGRVIPLRTRQMTADVLAPKVNGTLVLDALFKTRSKEAKPVFFLLCSSLDSFLAEKGQVAYTAANNFLDAYANASARASNQPPFIISLNWDAWQQVGMAAAAEKRLRGEGNLQQEQYREIEHPLFQQVMSLPPHRQVYVSRFSAPQCWFLEEHRVDGIPTLPGTAYLEMAVAALEHHLGQQPVEITHLRLLTPLMVKENEEKEVRTILDLNQGEGGYEFTIVSPVNATSSQWQKHAEGRMVPLPDLSSPSHDLGEIEQQCDGQEIVMTEEVRSQGGVITTGPRWDHFCKGKHRNGRGFAQLRLPHAFLSDISTHKHKLHPALLDTATSFLNDTLREKNDTGTNPEAWLPVSIRRVRVNGPLPAEVFSFVRYAESFENPGKIREFDITIMDSQGCQRVDIGGFTLLAVSQVGEVAAGSGEKIEFETRSTFLQDALAPWEGIEVFKRVLARPLPQVLVSTTDFPLRLAQHQSVVPSAREEEESLQRPDISTQYAAPATRTQQVLASIWQRLLGIQEIGIHDDFFELGGDSLKALTIISHIHKELNVEVSLTEFFSAPFIRALAEHIDSAGESLYASIVPVELQSHYPLSSAQKRLYFLQELRKESVFYNLPEAAIIDGRLDIQRFDRSLQVLIQRHESLRTSFEIRDGQPVQVIYPEVEFKTEYFNAEQHSSEAARRAQGIERKTIKGLSRSLRPVPLYGSPAGDLMRCAGIIEAFVRPFDLSQAPLLRVKMVKVAEEKYLWLWDIHHIAADATGIAVLKKDLLKLYHEDDLPPLRIQYKDFSQWQTLVMGSGKFKTQEEYWSQVFSHDLPPASLPVDFPRPAVSTFEGDRYYFKVEKEETSAFMEMGSAVGVTLFINLLAALNVLLFKYSGHNDIIIGSAAAGRPHADLQQILGMFVNILPMRNFPHETMTYEELLEQVKKTALQAFENQDMPFDMLVDKLQLGRYSSGNPLFELCLNVVNYEDPEFKVEELTCTSYQYETRTTTFDMLLWAEPKEDELYFMLSYSTELFKSSTAEKFGQRLKEVIKQVGPNKNIKLGDIKISHDLLSLESNIFQDDTGEFHF